MKRILSVLALTLCASCAEAAAESGTVVKITKTYVVIRISHPANGAFTHPTSKEGQLLTIYLDEKHQKGVNEYPRHTKYTGKDLKVGMFVVVEYRRIGKDERLWLKRVSVLFADI